jgi:hypothetical protein
MAAARSRSIEQGRKPGASVQSLLPGIIRWKEAVGHPDAGIVIARAIRRRGVKGRFFKRAAQDAVANAKPKFMATLAGKILSFWQRSR